MRQDVSHQFGLLVYSEDTHRIGPVSLDRAAAETQPQADFFARFALGDQLHDLSLKGCQRPLLVRAGRADFTVLNSTLGDVAAQRRASLSNLPNCLDPVV